MPDEPAAPATLLAERNPSSLPSPERLPARGKVGTLVQSFRQIFPARESDDDDLPPTQKEQDIDQAHKALIDNVRDVRGLTAEDIMVPRADIVALPNTTTETELMALYLQRPHTRLPIYQDTLDDIIGFIHIKDVLTAIAGQKPVVVRDLMRDVMIVSPAKPVLDLLVEMQQNKRQLAVIVDEYGGIDGLVAINDIIEAIVGEMRDEHINTKAARLLERADGTILADARVYIDDFEGKYGAILSDDEREEIDTLGGLVMSLAGHLPTRGELLTHPSGWQFEVTDADPRRVKRLRLRRPEPKPDKVADKKTETKDDA